MISTAHNPEHKLKNSPHFNPNQLIHIKSQTPLLSCKIEKLILFIIPWFLTLVIQINSHLFKIPSQTSKTPKWQWKILKKRNNKYHRFLKTILEIPKTKPMVESVYLRKINLQNHSKLLIELSLHKIPWKVLAILKIILILENKSSVQSIQNESSQTHIKVPTLISKIKSHPLIRKKKTKNLIKKVHWQLHKKVPKFLNF